MACFNNLMIHFEHSRYQLTTFSFENLQRRGKGTLKAMPLQNRSLSRVCSNSVFKMLNGRLPMKEEFQGPKTT